MNKSRILLSIMASIVWQISTAQNKGITTEKGGMVTVEAESFVKQSNDDIRKWYIILEKQKPNIEGIATKNEIATAGGKAYIQILPDTRRTHDDKLIKGENFSDAAGKLGVLTYNVKFTTPGRYYVWVKSYSSGSEDNGVHVGLDGQWPESGQRMQWCEGKRAWTWASKQRTKENHCGEQGKIFLDVKTAGEHTIQFSMREDGFAMDQFILHTDSGFRPQGYVQPPPPKPKKVSGTIQSSKKALDSTKIVLMKAVDFDISGTNFYKEKNNKWLAINPNEYKEAITSMPFPFENGKYIVSFLAVGENDGSSSFIVYINNKQIIDFTPPLSKEMFEEGARYNTQVKNIQVNKGDTIKVFAKIGSSDGKEYSRGRWAGVSFLPVNP